MAVHGTNMSTRLKNDIFRAGGDDKSLAKKAMARVVREIRKNPKQRYLLGTSQAVDIINGGVKGTLSNYTPILTAVNALPESVYAVVNHRIAMESSVKEVEDHLIDLLTPLSKSLPANFIAFSQKISSPEPSSNPRNTTIILSTTPDTLDPAPVSPEDSYAWGVLSSTVKHVFGRNVVISPSLMSGNTDTKFYWELSRDIWRFTPIGSGGRGNAHTVDESVGAKEHVEGFGFYVKLIRGADTG
jgi:Gly-Xaa carboxypeptidase